MYDTDIFWHLAAELAVVIGFGGVVLQNYSMSHRFDVIRDRFARKL